MPLHNIAFWFCAFFLLGVFFASIFNQIWIVVLSASLSALYFVVFSSKGESASGGQKYAFALLILLVIAGAFYYQAFDNIQRDRNIPFDEKLKFSALITKIESSATKQKIEVKLLGPYDGKIRINARRYPDFSYGDVVKAEGMIKEPLPETANYLAKDGIFGICNYPKIELVKSGQGNFIKTKLLYLKENIIDIFKNTLSSQKAAFLSGITLGERASFSKEFEEKMSLSGTTHLVALSGYNISVIVWAMALMFGSFFPRRISFYLSVLVIILFVLMTGGEASIIRAAIMGIIALLAKETERIYSVRNAIVIAAFLMALFNPRILVFDLGFQLSFAALLGIVYLLPVLKELLHIETPGLLSWKVNALTTVSAQLAVVPLLLGNFGVFSLTSFLANILILSAVPVTMGLGFIMGSLGLISGFLSQVVGFIVNLFLTYELWIIDIFSHITIPIITESFGFFAATVYYLILIGLICKFKY